MSAERKALVRRNKVFALLRYGSTRFDTKTVRSLNKSELDPCLVQPVSVPIRR